MKLDEMGKELRFMDWAMRSLNNEDYFAPWLMNGIADGDADMMNDEELAEYYADDYEDIRALFNRIITRAMKDAVKEDYDLFYILRRRDGKQEV